ncbi:MAG: hypothetical protein DMG61_08270, partial [Acidobacteria bacterium]
QSVDQHAGVERRGRVSSAGIPALVELCRGGEIRTRVDVVNDRVCLRGDRCGKQSANFKPEISGSS